MNTLKKLFLLAAMFGFSGIAFAQTALTQTTLSAAVNGPAAYNGTSQNTDTCMTLASVTNIAAPNVGGTPQFLVYTGREGFGVLTVNTTTKIVCGIRGYFNTIASPHPSGDMVLYGPLNTLGQGAGFNMTDPPLDGSCTAGSTQTTPWINISTGTQWLCSSISSSWVPSWNNPLAGVSPGTTAAVASAAALLPSGPLFHVTGTTGITSFSIPVGFDATASGEGKFCYITDSTATTSVGNNIGTAVTGVAGQLTCWYWDAANSKFYSK